MKLTMRKANYLLGIIGILGGFVILYLSHYQELPFFKKGLPGAGFFPIICGVAITTCSVILIFENFYQSRVKRPSIQSDTELDSSIINLNELRNFVYIIGSSVLVLLATKYIGLLFSIGLTVIGLVKWMARETWKKSFLIGIITTIILYLIFDSFLGVSLPDSIIGF